MAVPGLQGQPMRPQQESQENPLLKSLPALRVPPSLWDDSGSKESVSSGDKEMLSAVVGVYAFVGGLAEQIRYISFLRIKVKSLLLKKGRLSPYRAVIDECKKHWADAVNLSNVDEDWDSVIVMLDSIEEVLQAIAEREGLTANTRDAYRGEIFLPGPIHEPGA